MESRLFDFDEALRKLRAGKCVRRERWTALAYLVLTEEVITAYPFKGRPHPLGHLTQEELLAEDWMEVESPPSDIDTVKRFDHTWLLHHGVSLYDEAFEHPATLYPTIQAIMGINEGKPPKDTTGEPMKVEDFSPYVLRVIAEGMRKIEARV